MKKSKNLKDNLRTQNSDFAKKDGWKIQDIPYIIFAVIIAISIPVLMAIAIINYASLYKDEESPNVREQINEEAMIQGGFGGY